MSYVQTEISANLPLSYKNEIEYRITELGIRLHKIIPKIQIIVYNTQEELFKANNVQPNEKLVGFVDKFDCKKVHIISEQCFIDVFSKIHPTYGNLELMYKLSLLHECIHCLQFYINPNLRYSKNIQLIEGMAVFESQQLIYMVNHNTNKGDYYKWGKYIENLVASNSYNTLLRLLMSEK